jgi:16S rRNA (uracil1498-N3)-methyltransferase
LPGLTLLFAPIKSARLDFLVEKATELGATHLRPVMTERTQADRVNTRRLRETAREAAEQCGRMDVPIVDEPEKLAAVLAKWPGEAPLYLCAESGEAIPMRDAVMAGPGAVLVGPEGGFSPAEFTHLRGLPFVVPVSLGPRILRAETAAIAALTCWQNAVGDWKVF